MSVSQGLFLERKRKPKRKAKRKVKYYKISFSISEKEKHLLTQVCTQENIGFKSLCKKAIRTYVKERAKEIEIQTEISKNQLDLFKPTPPYQNKLNF